MKLYVTYTSPYARLARIVVVEKGLEALLYGLKYMLVLQRTSRGHKTDR
jgi:hypothetical protein